MLLAESGVGKVQEWSGGEISDEGVGILRHGFGSFEGGYCTCIGLFTICKRRITSTQLISVLTALFGPPLS